MPVLHANKSSVNELSKLLDTHENNKDMHFFVFIFMDGCGHCEHTKPEWKKLEGSKHSSNPSVMIVDLNEQLLNELGKSTLDEKSMRGYPTLRYINNGKHEDYEKAKGLKKKDRSSESFEEWIESKLTKSPSSSQKGGSTRKRRTTKKYRGGKWSMKYKRSINCRRPKGFSQRQHCKYGRKKMRKN
jgi:hypothetical protein